MQNALTISELDQLPHWRRPKAFLVLIAIAMPLAFMTWMALLNNFVIDMAQFDGADIGLLHTMREIPGFLPFAVVFLLLVFREQPLALMSLALLAISTAITAWFPSLGGILLITTLSSIGFHYFETVNQSLQLQWLKKEEAPQFLGFLLAVGSRATLVSYVVIVLAWEYWALSYNLTFLVAGGLSLAIVIYCALVFPRFEAPTPQNRGIILRKRYWLYYVLQFLSGARRQIFVVFAGFMMVERFGFEVHEVTSLYLINLISNMILGPFIGRCVARFGEKNALLFEYLGLFVLFLCYAGIYLFHWGVVLACVLYVLDHILFAMALALKTYFQKIADPADIAPTAAVAFTINHIAAVFLPVLLGLIWLLSPALVFAAAALIALASFLAALLIPRNPAPGFETLWGAGAADSR